MNNTHTPHTPDPVRDRVMSTIKMGEARMRPRWHFVLISSIFAVVAFILVLLLVFAISLSIFLLRESGVWFATSFGVRGWFALVSSIPIFYIVFVLFFIVLLELVIRRYPLVYRWPLAGSFLFVAGFIVLGGALLAQTPLHQSLASYARTHTLPAPLDLPYGPSARIALPASLYEGVVVSNKDGVLVIERQDDGLTNSSAADRATGTAMVATSTRKSAADNYVDKGTSDTGTTVRAALDTVIPQKKESDTDQMDKKQGEDKREDAHGEDQGRGKKQTRVVVDPRTRLPQGKSFKIGTRILVEGDRVGTDTVKAFGVRDIDD
ncbi:hypothetical protein HZC00_01950 [Candidatus Kaiserbacteria bacterium]|nr:hypothetical protein [Candidatus Kaiserbacteria bacterium]